jgi:hypothetical protein
LTELKPSLSPSRFFKGAFNNFRKKANRAINEVDVIAKAFPILKDNNDVPFNMKRTFANLVSLTDGTIVDAQPDFYYGARPD